jgi:hypothetical protein
MKYKYLYQTSENENREGWIKAPSRAEAYALLRKEGIRPYRLIGNDPKKWPKVLFGSLAGLVLIIAGVFYFIFAHEGNGPIARCQLEGEPVQLSFGMASGWEGVFETVLDRYLASYAQPGWLAITPEIDDGDIAGFVKELEKPISFSISDAPHIRQLKRILLKMRLEMKEYLAAGGGVKDYLAFLESRQEEERSLRSKAVDALNRAPKHMKELTRINLNARLREMGLAEIKGVEK